MKRLLVIAALLVSASAFAGRDVALKKTIAEGDPLVVEVEGDLSMCKDYPCVLNIEQSADKEKPRTKVEVSADGSWIAWHKDPVKEKAEAKKKEEEAKAKKAEEKAKKKDKTADAEKKDEDWKSKPILTVEERRLNKRNKVHKDMDEVGKGVLEGSGTARILTIPAALLPKGPVLVWANGWWGARMDGKKIGAKYGIAKISR